MNHVIPPASLPASSSGSSSAMPADVQTTLPSASVRTDYLPPPDAEPAHDLMALLSRQKQAFAKDLLPSRATREARLNRLKGLVDRYAERFSGAIAADFGARSPLEIRLTETMLVHNAIRHARRHLGSWMKTRRIGTAMMFRPGRSKVIPQPLGVVGIISPWNYPMQLALAPLVSVLAAGNRAMIKPSELTPRFSTLLQAAVAEFFTPDEVIVVTGDHEVGRAFSSLPFDHLLFTGSTEVGRAVAVAAAKNLTPVTLELGGKSPAIIDPSCHLAATSASLAWGKLLNAGQTCIAPDYVLVPRALLGPFVQALRASMLKLYPTFAGNPDYTGIISERHRLRLRAMVEDARAHGAQVIELEVSTSQSPASGQLPPVLLLDVDDSMRVMQEEIFGPLLPVIPYDTLDDALNFVDQRDRPLALYWFGTDRAARERVLTGSLAGGVTINDTLLHVSQDGLPFGGVGASGQGHYHGEYGFIQFSKLKPVFVQSRWNGMGLVRPPFKTSLSRLLDRLSRLG